MIKTIEKFAWLPKRVWNMKRQHYRYTYVWFGWYWDSGEQTCKTNFYRLSDDPYETPMQLNRYCRSNTNKW